MSAGARAGAREREGVISQFLFVYARKTKLNAVNERAHSATVHAMRNIFDILSVAWRLMPISLLSHNKQNFYFH